MAATWPDKAANPVAPCRLEDAGRCLDAAYLVTTTLPFITAQWPGAEQKKS